VSYYFIPTAIEEKAGKKIIIQQTEKLKRSVFGRYMEASYYTDKEKVKITLNETG
jgi:hypothetical protein